MSGRLAPVDGSAVPKKTRSAPVACSNAGRRVARSVNRMTRTPAKLIEVKSAGSTTAGEGWAVFAEQPSLLKLVKRGVLHAAQRTGVFTLVSGSRWRRQRLLIYAFHSLALDQEHCWRRLLYFTPDEFRHRLRLLQRLRVNVLTFDDGIARLQAGTLPPRSVVLTFDDGQADFSEIAWPELERFGYPATVYVTTYYSEKRLPIFPLMVSYVLWKAGARQLPALPDWGISDPIDLADEEARELAALAIVTRCDEEGLTAEEKDDRIRAIAARIDVDYETLRRRRVLDVMTPEEMRAVAARGADVELHTHRHRVPLVWDGFAREVRENRERIEALTGRRAVHFCYPSGVTYPEFLPWLAELGVRTATTCAVGLASRDESPLLLPRLIDTAALSDVEIEGWLTGFSQCLRQRRTQDAPTPMPEGYASAR